MSNASEVAQGWFDFSTSKTNSDVELAESVACRTPPLPFWERKSKAALVFPLNITFENICARDSCCLSEGMTFGRRF